jgi:hypothetical protein
MSTSPVWPQPPADDPLGESLWKRTRRDFWSATGSGQAGLGLLVIGAITAAVATWLAQKHNLDGLATAEWAVGLGIGLPLMFCLGILFAVSQRAARLQRDEARAEALRQRQGREASLALDLEDGLFLGEMNNEAVIQAKLKVRNTGTNSAPVHDWRAVLRIGDQLRPLRHIAGETTIRGSLTIPLLDRIGPLRPGLTVGYLQFVATGMRKTELEEIVGGDGPLALTVTAYGPVQRWEGEFDFRAPYAQRITTVDAVSPVERLRSFSRDGRRLQGEVPKSATPAEFARIEPRVDQLAARVRQHLFEHYPERIGEFNAVPAYDIASLASGRAAGEQRSVVAYLADLVALVDRVIQAA